MTKPTESSGFDFEIAKNDIRYSWDSKKVEQLMVALDDGYKPKSTPFYEGNFYLRKGNIVFDYTKEEIKEIKKCATDIVYFANTYCTVMTDQGLQTIELRDYQEDMLRQFQRERFNVCVASRQVGKCSLSSTKLLLYRDGKAIETTIGRLYMESLKQQRNLTFIEKLKYSLWKLYEYTVKHIILFLIQFLERIENRDIDLDQDDITKKILSSIKVTDIKVETDSGFQPISHIHITQPYQVWDLVLDNGMYLECADNHIIFNNQMDEVFVKDLEVGQYIQTSEGLVKVKSLKNRNISVSMFDVTVDSKDHRYYTNGILSHNTICSSIFIAWYVLFNFDKNALILSNKGATTREIIDKGKTILEHLPFFLKPGIVKYDVFNSKFDNGCRIIGQSTTKKAAIGFTIHLLFMDEFAHIPHNFVNTFYENVYPTVSASAQSKVIITSTPNGFNKFYDIYSAAEKGLSEYTPFRVDWWDVPGRDEKWMEAEIANLGTEEAFHRQYGNQFIASSSLLLSPASLKKIGDWQEDFIFKDVIEMEDIDTPYDGLVWAADFDIESIEEENNYWLFSIDLAEGNGGDHSVINMFKIETMPLEYFKLVTSPGSFIDFFCLKQVARFRSNEHTIEDFAKILYTLAFDMFYGENVKMIIEWNMFGSELVKRLQTVFPQRNNFDEEVVVKFKHRVDARAKRFGLKVKKDNKPIFCQNFKKYVAQNRIIISEKETVREAGTFGKMPNGVYAGQLGNDDLIMTCINSTEFLTTVDFSEFAEEIYEIIPEDIQHQIEKMLEQDSKGGHLNYDIYDIV